MEIKTSTYSYVFYSCITSTHRSGSDTTDGFAAEKQKISGQRTVYQDLTLGDARNEQARTLDNSPSKNQSVNEINLVDDEGVHLPISRS